MTRAYSVAFNQNMVQRLTGKNALSASELARETGVRQQNLSRWRDAMYMGTDNQPWSVMNHPALESRLLSPANGSTLETRCVRGTVKKTKEPGSGGMQVLTSRVGDAPSVFLPRHFSS